MPFQYEIFEAPDYVHVAATGAVDVEEYFSYFRKCVKDAAFYPAIPILYELGSEATVDIADIRDEDVDAMMTMIQGARKDAQYRVAIAGGSPDTRTFFAMAQEIANDEARCRSFGTVLDAVRWLDSKAGPSSKK